jgi:hypothetical protein
MRKRRHHGKASEANNLSSLDEVRSLMEGYIQVHLPALDGQRGSRSLIVLVAAWRIHADRLGKA